MKFSLRSLSFIIPALITFGPGAMVYLDASDLFTLRGLGGAFLLMFGLGWMFGMIMNQQKELASLREEVDSLKKLNAGIEH